MDKASAWKGPRLACGPVLLGVSGTTKPWVIGRALYSTNLNGDDATDFLLYNPNTGVFYQARNDGDGGFSYAGGGWAPWPRAPAI